MKIGQSIPVDLPSMDGNQYYHDGICGGHAEKDEVCTTRKR